MIQKIILFFLLGGILLPMHAQINGTVVDSESNPISFANVALYTVPDSMLIAGTITNREGHFSLNTENQIDAFIKVSFIGFDLRSTYLQTENTDLRQQLNMNYRNNGWDLFGTLKYERYAYLQESIIRQSTYVDTLWTQENQLRVDGLSNPLTVVAGINYEFSPKQQAGVKYTLTTFPGKNRDIANTISDVYANGSFYDRLVSQDHQQQDLQPRHRLNGYYCGTFGKLTVDFNGDFYRSIQTTRSNITETSEEQDDRTIGSDNRIFNRLFATRTILTHPLLGGTLSVGNEFTRTHREDDYQTSNPMIPSSATEIHDQNLSFFAEYSRATPVGQITAGLRYEDVFWDYFRDGERNDELLAVFTAGGILETGEECHHPVGRTDGGEPGSDTVVEHQHQADTQPLRIPHGISQIWDMESPGQRWVHRTAAGDGDTGRAGADESTLANCIVQQLLLNFQRVSGHPRFPLPGKRVPSEFPYHQEPVYCRCRHHQIVLRGQALSYPQGTRPLPRSDRKSVV